MYMYIPKLIVLYNSGVYGFESHPLTTLTLCVHLLCLVSFSLVYMYIFKNMLLLLLQVPVYILIELQISITNFP